MMSVLYGHLTSTVVPILLTGVGFGLLITVHELGHLFFCKLFGIGAPVFSIGFGPTLVRKQIGETEFRLSLIPLGGYCAVQGMEDPEMGLVDSNEAHLDPRGAFNSKPFWQKMLVLLGGIAFNLLFAYFIFVGMNVGTQPETKTELVICYITPKSAAESHQIEVGHTLVGYENSTFSTDRLEAQKQLTTFLDTLSTSPGKVIKLILRSPNGSTEKKRVTVGGAKTGTLGVGIEMKQVEIPGKFITNSLATAFKKGIESTHAYIGATAGALTKMFKRRTLDGMGGPITMFSQTFKSARVGLRALWEFLGMISITLALMNLLPIGALDGGQLLFVLIEGIIRRPLNQRLKEYIIIASWILFLLLVIILSYRDIVRLVW